MYISSWLVRYSTWSPTILNALHGEISFLHSSPILAPSTTRCSGSHVCLSRMESPKRRRGVLVSYPSPVLRPVEIAEQLCQSGGCITFQSLTLICMAEPRFSRLQRAPRRVPNSLADHESGDLFGCPCCVTTRRVKRSLCHEVVSRLLEFWSFGASPHEQSWGTNRASPSSLCIWLFKPPPASARLLVRLCLF